MSEQETASVQTPVYKVGGIIMRHLDSVPEVLITQPRIRDEKDIPPMGLPRGTRRYLDTDGTLKDARDPETARAHADTLEPLTDTLQSEMHEEAGLRPEWLVRQPVFDMGTHAFSSRSKAPYPIQWYVITPDAATQEKMKTEPTKDADFTQWVSVADLKRRAAFPKGEMGSVNPAYVPLVEEAISKMQAQDLPKVSMAVARLQAERNAPVPSGGKEA